MASRVPAVCRHQNSKKDEYLFPFLRPCPVISEVKLVFGYVGQLGSTLLGLPSVIFQHGSLHLTPSHLCHLSSSLILFQVLVLCASLSSSLDPCCLGNMCYFSF